MSSAALRISAAFRRHTLLSLAPRQYAHLRATSTALGRRALSTETPDADYYRILGVSRDADASAIKAGFHAAAKRYHPDVHGEGSAELFKRVNEAYTVLSEPGAWRRWSIRVRSRRRSLADVDLSPFLSLSSSLSTLADSKRAYDAGRYASRPSGAAAPQQSTTTLRERNEGTFGGVGPVDPESADAFREAMHRSAARVKDGARTRASLSRLQRAQVDVPPVGTVSVKFALPFIAAGIWAVNWVLFMR
jgi:hypothetical protein